MFPPLVEPASDLTIEEFQRYSRHVIIPNVGEEGQRRLKAAKVLCIGAGGLGSPVLMYLAAAGVGEIGVVDFDVVDVTNLQRQIIHGQSDIGHSKAHSAKAAMAEINPLITITIHEERLDNANAMAMFAKYDLIIDGTDNFATRYLVNDAAVLLQKPYVWGSLYRFEGQASVFWTEHGPCYRCLYPTAPPAHLAPSCAEGGVLGVLCASIGSIQATEAIKLITGIGEPLVGRLMHYDALAMQYRTLPIARDPQCAICGDAPSITELIDYEAFCGITESHASAITATDLSRMLMERSRGQRDFLLIDVREQSERDIVAIDGSILMQQHRFADGSALSELPIDQEIVLHCKSGKRSAECLSMLRAAGYARASHLSGGILQWIDRIEPTKPRY